MRIRSELMKLFTVFLFFLLFGHLASSSVLSQTSASTPSATEVSQDIQMLKDKIATKVAELREKNNKAVGGFVTDVVGSTIKIKTENNQEYEVKPDEALAKYYKINGSQRNEIKFQDIKKGSYIIATGVTNDQVINADTIYLDELYIVKSGKIIEVDKDNYQVKILTSDKDSYTLEIETTTKQSMINIKSFEIEKTGFSKIKEGDTIHFVAKKTGTEKNNQYSAQKILIIPQEYFIK